MKRLTAALVAGVAAAAIGGPPVTEAASGAVPGASKGAVDRVSAAPDVERTVARAASAAGRWRLVLNDRFDSPGIPGHWRVYDGPYGGKVVSCASPEQAFVRRGSLRMRMSYRRHGACGAGWYSAGMMLADRFKSIDQRIAVRFRVRSVGGVRAHRIIPMRWPADNNFPQGGEEDFCESKVMDSCMSYLHGARKRKDHEYKVDLTRWHTMVFVREGFTVRAFIDGRRRWVYHGDRRTLPATRKRPVLQQECGWGCPTNRKGREVISIDWIKVWKPR